MLGLVACGPKAGEADGDGSNSGTGSGTASESDGTATATATADDDGSSGGDVPVDGRIDCLDIPSGSPTVAPTPLSPLGFPAVSCVPAVSGDGEWTCCSDDPEPFFSGANNDLSQWGMCVRTADIPPGSGTANPANCPLPCNPTWAEEDVLIACGPARVCCQTLELQPEDCIQDPGTGDWRPATGDDIGNATNWGAGVHATHQDPGGNGCSTATGGGGSGNDDWEAWRRQPRRRRPARLLHDPGPGTGLPPRRPRLPRRLRAESTWA